MNRYYYRRNAVEKRQVRLAIRDFVESMYMEGDLVGASSPGRAMEGMRVHKGMQADRGEQYSSEVPVSFSISGTYVELQLFGRIDGLTIGESGVTIEEIKSVRGFADGEGFEGAAVHWAQAKAYAAIYCRDNSLERIAVQLVYFDVIHEREKRLERAFTAAELLEWLTDLCGKYLRILDREEDRLLTNSRIIREMGFPYDKMRPGQEEMMAAVYSQVKSGGFLYVSAPTGIGKTMGALFPAVKAMADGHCRKLFYLTARNPVKTVAEDALKTLIKRGFALRGITLAAKDRLCPMPEGTPCSPEHCPKAAGFFDRLFTALDEVPPVGHMGRRDVEKLAAKYDLCPHELSLFIAEACDIVICDYNHAFDPRVKIKRFFEKGGAYMLLVDEAHNLVDRGRDMFSAELSEATARAFLDGLPLFMPEGMAEASFAAQTILERLQGLKGALGGAGEDEAALESVPDGLLGAAEEFIGAAEPVLSRTESGEAGDVFLDLYFMARVFRDVAEDLDEYFRVLVKRTPEGIELHLRCIDPSRKLREAMKRIHGAVFYSATLTPFKYYAHLTGAGDDASYLKLPSPFPRENLKVLALDIETTYAKREGTLHKLVEALAAFVGGKMGNYLVFFPSYRYMQAAHDIFVHKCGVFSPMQSSGMTERERAEFLRFFDAEHERGMAAFAVMGGIFGEGIDLVGDRVIGVAIVGVGMPQLCLERNLIQQHHDEMDEPGYDYSYVIPGFNRVMQAVGRLIRGDFDRGVVLLADRRFGWPKYDEMTPEWWQPVTPTRSAGDIKKEVKEFWNEYQ
jgi:DNA excision repair protein ERCC-2